jgi:hypothetical protein
MSKKNIVGDKNKKIEEISKDLVLFQKKVDAIQIKDEKHFVNATEMLSQIKARQKRIEDIRKFFVNPLNSQVKAINAEFKKVSMPLAIMEQQIKEVIISYRQEVEIKRLEDEKKMQQKWEKKQEKDKEKGKVVDFSLAPTIPKQATSVESKSGEVKFRKVWKFEIEVYSELPKNVVDEVLYQAKEVGIYDKVLRKMISQGIRDIKGVRIYEAEEPAVHL